MSLERFEADVNETFGAGFIPIQGTFGNHACGCAIGAARYKNKYVGTAYECAAVVYGLSGAEIDGVMCGFDGVKLRGTERDEYQNGWVVGNRIKRNWVDRY